MHSFVLVKLNKMGETGHPVMQLDFCCHFVNPYSPDLDFPADSLQSSYNVV